MQKTQQNGHSQGIVSTLILLTLLVSGNAHANERWFSIEVIVFERLKNNAHLEHWPVPKHLGFPQPRLFFPSDTDASSAANIREIEFNGPLKPALQKLQRSNAYKVLAARHWQQSLLPKAHAPHLVFKGGQANKGRYELEGSLQFSVERYLHLKANLWFTEFAKDGEVADTYVATTAQKQSDYDDEERPTWSLPPLPKPPLVMLPDSDTAVPDQNTEVASLADILQDNGPTLDGIDNSLAIERIITLKQQRRLRSTEIHYIDHPRYGMLVHILPLDMPNDNNAEDDIL